MKPRIVCIGGGLAGVYFSLRAAQFAQVDLFCKDDLLESNSYLAKGGIAIAIGSDDSLDQHIKDTLSVGAGLCDTEVVNYILSHSGEALTHLIELGIHFNRNEESFDLGKEGGHSKNRIVHIMDETGKFMMESLYEKVKNNPNIRVNPFYQLTDLVVDEGKCKGAVLLNAKTARLETIMADAVVLATGGCGRLYLKNTNSSIATGDGIAIAYRAGAEVRNMEFIQFHPTMLYEPDSDQSYLITEAFRGAGAKLVNTIGEAYMSNHPLKSLAPRDIVSRNTFEQMRSLNSPFVYLESDPALIPQLVKRFPGLAETCEQKNIPLDKIPVTPAAHYCCGGVKINLKGQTNIKHLYAIGEVAYTGLHGGNRLASNSLLENVVMAEAAFNDLKDLQKWVFEKDQVSEEIVLNANEETHFEALKNLMWYKFGIVRNETEMKEASEEIANMIQENEMELTLFPLNKASIDNKNRLLTASLIAKAALDRKESLGCHFRSDYPVKKKLNIENLMLELENKDH